MKKIADNLHCAKYIAFINYSKGVVFLAKRCEIRKSDQPVWEPLEKILGEKCKHFTYIGKVALGEVWVFLYKHIHTRRYLNLDGRGYAYRRNSDGLYYPVKIQDALNHVFGRD